MSSEVGHVKWLLLAAAGLLALCARAAAGPAPRETTRADQLAKTIQDNELKLRSSKDPAERQRLVDDTERARHEMGPYDPSGTRNHCQAMWHDSALETLDAEVKRLAGRAKSTPAAPLALEAKLHTRRMAAKCIERGWGWGGELPKYQFDAYGQYLTNNLTMLDVIFDSVGAIAVKEEKAGAADPARKPIVDAIAQAREGLSMMGQATNGFANATGKDLKSKEAMVATLASFAEGLRTFCEASTDLQELTGKQEKTEPTGTAPPEAKRAEAAALTIEDKLRLAKVRAVAEILKDEEWATIRKAIEQFAAVAEQGLQVTRTRSRAMELLNHLALATDYIQELMTGKCASQEGTDRARKLLAGAFESLGNASYRQYGYAEIRRIWDGAGARRTLDASPLSAEAAKGILLSFALRYDDFKPLGKDYPDRYEEFNLGGHAVIDILNKVRDWPPKEMSEALAPHYKELSASFLRACEAAGRTSATELENLYRIYPLAGNCGRDMERLIQADRAIKAVAKYVPSRAGPMTAELVRDVQELATKVGPAQQSARTRIDAFIKPFATLAELELPGAEHQALAAKLVGAQSCRQALNLFGGQVTAGIDAALRGRPDALDKALDPRWMFRLLRHRCVVDADTYSRVDVNNLAPFSSPDTTWKQFVRALDLNLARTFQHYSTDRLGRAPQTTTLGDWDEVYCAVAVAQRLTAASRRQTDTDRDLLLRNLERVSDPSPLASVWYGWAVGYHMTEAATAMAAGLEGTAGWHRTALRYLREDHPLSRLYQPGELELPLPAAKPPAKPPATDTQPAEPKKEPPVDLNPSLDKSSGK